MLPWQGTTLTCIEHFFSRGSPHDRLELKEGLFEEWKDDRALILGTACSDVHLKVKRIYVTLLHGTLLTSPPPTTACEQLETLASCNTPKQRAAVLHGGSVPCFMEQSCIVWADIKSITLFLKEPSAKLKLTNTLPVEGKWMLNY